MRAEAAVAFNHVLDIVLDSGDASLLKSSLLAEGITDIFDLNTINDNVIDTLTQPMQESFTLLRKVIRCC